MMSHGDGVIMEIVGVGIGNEDGGGLRNNFCWSIFPGGGENFNFLGGGGGCGCGGGGGAIDVGGGGGLSKCFLFIGKRGTNESGLAMLKSCFGFSAARLLLLLMTLDGGEKRFGSGGPLRPRGGDGFGSSGSGGFSSSCFIWVGILSEFVLYGFMGKGGGGGGGGGSLEL
mmetsp:Transcript_20379/g.25201  ORF Transcript_20379/g.25201 Transcript_20379/m.25201 type:complete len:170 (-) Transcript_20379:500-1009(-)